jgi:hypothetical protein
VLSATTAAVVLSSALPAPYAVAPAALPSVLSSAAFIALSFVLAKIDLLAVSLNALWHLDIPCWLSVACAVWQDPILLKAMARVGADPQPVAFTADEWTLCFHFYGRLQLSWLFTRYH